MNPTTGAVIGSRSYSPFGEITASAGTQTALGYQHQYTDPGTGNVNMGARWYQPTTGGLASRDVATLDPRDIGNTNRYAYAGGDPLTALDPSGLFWGKVWDVVKEVSGYNDIAGCVNGSWSACGWAVAGFTPWGKAAKAASTAGRAVAGAVRGADNVPMPRGHVSAPPPRSRFDGDLPPARRADAPSPRRGVPSGAVVRGATKAGKSLKYGRAAGAALSAGGRAGSAAAAAAARAAAEAARQAARQAMVRARALTPAARPPLSPSLSPSMRASLEAANNQPVINLKVLDPANGAQGRAAADAGPFTPATDPTTATTANLSTGGTVPDNFIDLYHGTTATDAHKVRANGINHRAGRPDLDFGQGFYTTRDPKQAVDWAIRQANRDKDVPAVLHFRVPVFELEALTSRTFVEADDAWREFTLHHRSGGALHHYDMVEGPMVGNVSNLRNGGTGRP
ncbi:MULTISPECIES: DUF3990 domain-containing protein [Amycolatopsis]|uniref:DUF3990 domain-containing protein n=1 Tax=Amycolatopsis TaxID=1813 RepID=UPI000B8AA671|nr:MULTISPECIES: DUF3990 domain-containing protein [Amycolatopsis]OXM72814.1 hypothetical protein CF166_13265 [Amycolatopsis sp. KNN50.9b]